MRRRWDNKEINLLKNNYKKSWEILLKLLPGRTKPALYGELYGLNLHRGYDHLKENNPRFGKKRLKKLE